MRFLPRVEVADRSAEYATHRRMGSACRQSRDRGAGPGCPLVWHDPWTRLCAGWLPVRRRGSAPGGRAGTGARRSSNAIDSPALARGSHPARLRSPGSSRVEALRIAAWRPRLATEVDEKSIPHELDWLRSRRAPEQGLLPRAGNGGEGAQPRPSAAPAGDAAPRWLRGVLPARGDEVAARRRGRRTVTSVGLHYELGPIALAVVRRSADPAAELPVRLRRYRDRRRSR